MTTFKVGQRVRFVSETIPAEGVVLDVDYGCVKIRWDDGEVSIHRLDDRVVVVAATKDRS